MSWSSSASRPFEVMVKAPAFGLASPKAPSLAAIFIGTLGGSRFASAASLSFRSQSKSSAVRSESMPIIISRMHIQTVKAAYRRYARVYDALFGPVLQPGRKAVVKALGCRPGQGAVSRAKHLRSDNPLLGAVENSLARFSDKLGFRPDFALRDLVDGSEQVTEVARINLLWKVLRLRNGIAHPRFATSCAPHPSGNQAAR